MQFPPHAGRLVCRRASAGRIGASRQSGVALAMVVWFVAGMALLVSGIVFSARIDTRMAQLHVARAKVAAAGDGAVQLMLADQYLEATQETRGVIAPTRMYRLGDLDVTVTLQPSAGLIELNSATAEVLAALFSQAGAAGGGEASVLADNVIQWRAGAVDTTQTGSGAQYFHSAEDLLRVAGIDRRVFDAVRDLVVADGGRGGATDWALAPAALLPVLEETNAAALGDVHRRRESLAGSTEPGTGPRGLSGSYRADATIRYGGSTWLRRVWVASGGRSSSTLPWRVDRTEPPRVWKASEGDH